MPRGATGLAAEVERRFRQFQRGTVRPITWETVRSGAWLYAERRAGTPLDWLWRMTRARYDAMVAKGALEEDEPIELLDGLLIVREPEGGRHAVIVGRVRRALEAAFGQGCYVLKTSRSRSTICPSPSPMWLSSVALTPATSISIHRNSYSSSRWPRALLTATAPSRLGCTRGPASPTIGSSTSSTKSSRSTAGR